MTKLKHTSFASSYLEEKNNYRQILNDGGQLKLSIIAIVFASHPCFFLSFYFCTFFLKHLTYIYCQSAWSAHGGLNCTAANSLD